MPKKATADGGSIRQRGNSYQVRVRAGTDPVTGKDLVLTGSAGTLNEAREVRRRLLVRLDEERHARTRATFRVAMEKWLRVHEIDDSTREGYERYARLHLIPQLDPMPAGDQVCSRDLPGTGGDRSPHTCRPSADS